MDILSLLLEHQLPSSRPSSVLAGPGERLPCQVCQQPISPAEIQYEFEVSEPPWLDQSMRMHLPCYRAWHAELAKASVQELLRNPATTPPRSATLRFLLMELEVARQLLAIESTTHLRNIALSSRERSREIYERVLRLAGHFSSEIADHRTLLEGLSDLRRALDQPPNLSPLATDPKPLRRNFADMGEAELGAESLRSHA